MTSSTIKPFIRPLFALLVLLLRSDHVQGAGAGRGESLALIQRRYYELLADLEDEDEDCPPGPPGGWPHTGSFSTTSLQQAQYNHAVEEDMYVRYQEEYFAAYGGREAHGIHQARIARPEGSTTGYYTGVTHFRHVNDPDLVTFLFSAGRHDGGTNTYLTIDTSSEGNPFDGAQESFVDAEDISTWTWVSAHTIANRDGPVHHYALFSGGSGSGKIGPSKLYIFEEGFDGTLEQPPVVAWIEDVEDIRGSARYCLLADLGDIYDNDTGNQTSVRGLPDVIIAGTGGLDIYSTMGNLEWRRVRSISIGDLNDDTSAFLGVEALGRHLIIASRTRWNPNVGREFEAPCLVYDYHEDEIVQRFASRGQTVSVAALDDESRILVGAGGQASYTGQPNLLFDVNYIKQESDLRRRHLESKKSRSKSAKNSKTGGQGHSAKAGKVGTLSLQLSDPQLARGMPLNHTVYYRVDPVPVSSQEYFVVPSPGRTKTRQVLPFGIDKSADDHENDADLVLEVNSAQTCNIYYRMGDEPASKVMPLPGSEGFRNEETSVYARAGDTLLVGDTLYVIIAQFNGNNTVYSFSTEVF